ncbi:MAG: acetyl-CoA carboxylase biotin carboxyl carrier protein subunit [Bacteroidetes bacterium]|nr:acetyl-CoA carboxylase biotin carboxyl carrier protein subunit [Bacteroidota bacterium]
MESLKPKQQFQSIIIDNVKYKTLLTEKFKNRKSYIERDPKKIVAFIPGIIKKIYTKKGQNIKVGDKLIVLEAMKMNNLVISPIEGIIKEVKVQQGNRVAKEQLLLEFD